MFQSIAYVWPFIKQNKKRYIGGCLAAILENLMVAVPTYLVGLFVDDLVKEQLTLQKILLFLLAVVISVIVAYLASCHWTIAFYGSKNLAQKYYQDRFVKLILQRRQAFFEKYSTGDLLSRATDDVDYITDLVSWGMSLIFYAGSCVILYFILMVSKGGLGFTLLALLPYLFLLAFSVYREKEVEKRWQKRQKALAAMNDGVLEGVEGVRNIRAFAQEDAFRQRFFNRTAEYTRLADSVSSLAYTYELSSRLAALAVFLVTMAVGAGRVSRGEMSVGALISFQIFVTSLAFPLTNLASNVNVLQNANVSTQRLKELEEADDGMEDGEIKIDLLEEVVLADYSFTFPEAAFPAVDKVSLRLKRGETLGVVGKTGSGKSAFLRQFLREYPAGQGLFTVNGVDLACIAPSGLSPVLAYVHQDHQFFSGTIRENVAFSVDDASDEDIMQALEFASFTLDKELMREGLDTLIGEKGITLSGGQRQRLSLARAVLRRPDLLILDDSLSAVDQITEKQIIHNLEQAPGDQTRIISSHRLSAVKDADQIIVFQDGKIVERGSHEELMQSNGWYSEQFRHQEEV